MSLGADKPTELPRWADVGGLIVVPPSGKQDVGWAQQEQPPAEYFNWLHNRNYQWLNFLNNYFATHGEFQIQSASEATLQPTLTHYDYKGKPRSHVDHLGYRAGQVTDWYERWWTSGTTEPTGWTFSNVGGTRAYNDPDSNLFYRNVTLAVPAVATQNAKLVSLPILYAGTDVAFSTEVDVRTGAANWNGAGSMSFDWNVALNNGGAWNTGIAFDFTPIIGFIRTQYYTGGIVHDTFTSSVALALNATYRLRMEMVGSNLSSAGANQFTTRWYINGVLVHTYVDTTVWTGPDKARQEFVVANTGTALAASVQVGPIRTSWNHRLNQDLI